MKFPLITSPRSSLFVSLVMVCLVHSCTGTKNETKNKTVKMPTLDERLNMYMKPLYFMANTFLEAIQLHGLNDSSIDLLEIVTDPTGYYRNIGRHWQPFVRHYIGYVICAAIGIIFIVAMPFVAFFFCICRCCGNCGGRFVPISDPHDSAATRRVAYFLLILVWTAFIILGVICTFVTLRLIYMRLHSNTTTNPFLVTERSYDNFMDFLNQSYVELLNRTINDYRDFMDKLKQNTNRTRDAIVDYLMDVVNLTDAFREADLLASDINATYNLLTQLSNTVDNLKNHTKDVRTALLVLHLIYLKENPFTKCMAGNGSLANACTGLEERFKDVKIQPNYTSLPTFAPLKNTMKDLSDLQSKIAAARDEYDEVKKHKSLDSFVEEAMSYIAKASEVGEKAMEEGLLLLNNAIELVEALGIKEKIRNYNTLLTDKTHLWYYPLLTVSSIIAFIALLYILGLIFGFCAKRLAAYLLMAGVGFSLIFLALFMLVVVVMFLTGGLVYTEVCRYTVDHNPMSLTVYSDILEICGIYPKGAVLDVLKVLEYCRKDVGVYKSFGIENFEDLRYRINLSNIDSYIDMLSFDADFKDVHLPYSFKNALNRTANSNTSNIDLQLFRDVQKLDLTTTSLRELRQEVNSVAFAASSFMPSVSSQLQKLLGALNVIEDDLVSKFKQDRTKLNGILDELQKMKSLDQRATKLLNKFNSSEAKFNKIEITEDTADNSTAEAANNTLGSIGQPAFLSAAQVASMTLSSTGPAFLSAAQVAPNTTGSTGQDLNSTKATSIALNKTGQTTQNTLSTSKNTGQAVAGSTQVALSTLNNTGQTVVNTTQVTFSTLNNTGQIVVNTTHVTLSTSNITGQSVVNSTQVTPSTNDSCHIANDSSKALGDSEDDLIEASYIEQAVEKYRDLIKMEIKESIADLIDYVEFEVVPCRPVYYNAYNITDALCLNIIDPYNGFWFAIAWCVFFLVPCTIFAVHLAGLYRRRSISVEYSKKRAADASSPAIIAGGGKDENIDVSGRAENVEKQDQTQAQGASINMQSLKGRFGMPELILNIGSMQQDVSEEEINPYPYPYPPDIVEPYSYVNPYDLYEQFYPCVSPPGPEVIEIMPNFTNYEATLATCDETVNKLENKFSGLQEGLNDLKGRTAAEMPKGNSKQNSQLRQRCHKHRSLPRA